MSLISLRGLTQSYGKRRILHGIDLDVDEGQILGVTGPNGAGKTTKVLAGVGNVVAVLMWLTAGLWIPRAAFPDWAQTLTDLTPGGASGELLHTAIAGGDGNWQDVVVCLVWIAVSLGVAVKVFRWE